MTKHQLTTLLFSTRPTPITIQGVTGVVQSIQREDGSGSSFNVIVSTPAGNRVVYVRTID